MISILCPTRARPQSMHRLVRSGWETAETAIQFVLYVDEDDIDSQRVAWELGVSTVVGPRILLSEMWNRCWDRARYDIAMHCGDDIVFRTPGWDKRVLETFDAIPDRIALVWGRDGYQDCNLATHGFLHRRWVETLGYFVPPYFASDWNDVWLHEVAGLIDRRFFLSDVYTEHLHPIVDKAEWDITHRERIERHKRDNCDEIWRNTAHLRRGDANKLLAAIEKYARESA